MYIDFHTHILPAVDDGAKSFEESLKMLKMLKAQGVDAAALSPHFYPSLESSVEEYRERIVPVFEKFKEAVKDIYPELFLGCEVHLFHGISTFSALESLCIGESKYILIELPYRRISSKTVDDIIDLALSRKVVPILAHIERYRKYENYDRLLSLISEGYALGQINAYSLLRFKSRHAACRLIKDGYVSFIASDAHSADNNPPRIDEALRFVEKKFGVEVANKIKQNHNALYSELLRK